MDLSRFIYLTRRIQEGSAHQYFSAAWQVLEERNGSNQATVSYAWSHVYVDAMIARDRNTVGDASVLEERLYALQDANFNVTAIADTSGDIVERYLFDPYGQRTILDPNFSADADNTSDFAFMHGHQGGKYDSVLTNQMLFRNRVYDVETMRWMQQDPLGYIDGLCTYSYGVTNPITVVDPEGTTVWYPDSTFGSSGVVWNFSTHSIVVVGDYEQFGDGFRPKTVKEKLDHRNAATPRTGDDVKDDAAIHQHKKSNASLKSIVAWDSIPPGQMSYWRLKDGSTKIVDVDFIVWADGASAIYTDCTCKTGAGDIIANHDEWRYIARKPLLVGATDAVKVDGLVSVHDCKEGDTNGVWISHFPVAPWQ